MNSWIEYWNRDEFWASDKLWQTNAEIFVRQADKVLSFSPSDVILNIGCGVGYMEELLAPRVGAICAVDTSERFLQMTCERCMNFKNVKTGLLSENYTDLRGLGNFSIFLCVSIVQYYKNISEVEDLINSARSTATPGARMLIADIPLKRSFFDRFADLLSSLLQAMRGGYLKIFLKTILRYAKPNSYTAFCERHPSLFFTRKEIEVLIKKIGLRTQVIPENLSVWANRLNLLIFLGEP